MKRWTLRILLCLVLGAVTTVAVAWLAAFDLPVHNSDSVDHIEMVVDAGDLQTWKKHATDGWPEKPAECRLAKSALWERRSTYVSSWAYGWDSSWEPIRSEREFYKGHGGFRIERVSTGFPLRVFESEWWRGVPQAGHLFAPSIDHNAWEVGGLLIPTCPRWPGFATDTLFYAAIWFGVFFGFTSAKRFIRVRRGRCPRCGYDLRGNLGAGCPECGWQREESAP